MDVTPVVCDVLQPQTLEHLPQADTVVYAIGLDRSTGATMRSVYVDGLANVLARLPRPNRFIYVSSSSVYGQADGSWVDETSSTEPTEEAGQIVRAAETLLQAALPDAVILRFAGIYGPGRLLRQKTIQAGEPIVAGANKWLNLIHVDDGARAVLAAEHYAKLGGIYNICDGRPVQRRDFYTSLAQHLALPRRAFNLRRPIWPRRMKKPIAGFAISACATNCRLIFITRISKQAFGRRLKPKLAVLGYPRDSEYLIPRLDIYFTKFQAAG